MKKQDAFDAMRRQGWLSNQPDEFCTRLLTDANVRALEPGQVVFNAADGAHSLVGVASGTLEVFVDHPQLHEQLLHISRPGAWFGQRVAYGGSQRRSVSAVVIARQKIEAMIKEEPLCLRYFALLSELHLQESLTAIVELSQRDSFSKVCTRLISLGISLVRGCNAAIIEIPVTHDEFASLCGISRKTLSRALNELKQAGAIDVHYRSITILDVKLLSAIAAGDASPGMTAFQTAAS
jgi:CRP-like cAMP-binding protein